MHQDYHWFWKCQLLIFLILPSNIDCQLEKDFYLQNRAEKSKFSDNAISQVWWFCVYVYVGVEVEELD